MPLSQRKGFTLIELLIVIAIIAILAVVVVLVLNPAELLRQSRDANRVSDMNTIAGAVSLYDTDAVNNPSTFFMGTSTVIYISVPDPTAPTVGGNQCQGIGLPQAPAGYTYHCSSSSTFSNINGTGWIPINFNQYSAGTPISKLPVDPANATSTNLYYTYQTDGSGGYKTSAFLESQKDASLMATDGGTDPELFEKASNPNLPSAGRAFSGYWPLNEGTGAIARDWSGNNNTGTLTCTGTGCAAPTWVSGKFGPSAIFENPTGSQASYVVASPIVDPSASGAAVTVSMWVYPTNPVGSWQWLIREGGNSDENYGFQIGNIGGTGYSGGKFDISMEGFGAGNFQRVSTSGYIVPINTWSYITLVFTQGQNLKVYMNGGLQETLAFPYITQTSTSNLYIGNGYPFAGQPYDGYLDDVRVYLRALSSNEILEMYNAEK